MKFLVLSDTHGNICLLEYVLRLYSEQVSGIIHCGDGVRDIAQISLNKIRIPPCYSVKGNMDQHSNSPTLATINLEHQKVVFTHGHLLRLEAVLDDFVQLAKKEDAQAVLFGHTHIPLCKKRDGVFILNPGSLGKPRAIWGPSFCILNYDEGASFSADFYEVIKSGNDYTASEFTPL